jgi:outer membrane lipoprotein-sorting protein
MLRLESGFVQQSESAVFGKLNRQGHLKLAKGGRLRVEYRQGLLLVADGRSLTQYDPDARTAQRTTLRSAAADVPLLNILLNPADLAGFYEAKAGPGQTVALEPRRPGLPRVVLTGNAGLLRRIQWQDATGASQQIELQDPRVPAAPFDPAVFTFQAPAGTRWLNPR